MLPGEYRKSEEGRYNKNMNLSRLAANRVVGEVTVHYRKAHIITMAENKDETQSSKTTSRVCEFEEAKPREEVG